MVDAREDEENGIRWDRHLARHLGAKLTMSVDNVDDDKRVKRTAFCLGKAMIGRMTTKKTRVVQFRRAFVIAERKNAKRPRGRLVFLVKTRIESTIQHAGKFITVLRKWVWQNRQFFCPFRQFFYLVILHDSFLRYNSRRLFTQGRKRGRNLPIRTLLGSWQTDSNATRKTRPKRARPSRTHI